MELTDVHMALMKAQDTANQKVALINANFKLNPFKKELAEQICWQNATTLSAFLRECVDGLIKDYTGERTSDELEEGAI